MDFDEDPLDLLEDDGDGVNETILFFDKDEEKGQNRPKGTGCSVVLFLLGTGLFSAGSFLIVKAFS